MCKKLIPCSYYVIKTVCDKDRRTYYKIGQTIRNRDEYLLNLYSNHGHTKTELVLFDKMPCNKTKMLSDTTIRNYLLFSGKFESVDPKTIEGCLHTTDGVTEFVNCLDDTIDVADYIAKVVSELNHSKYFTIDVRYNLSFDSNTDELHKVNARQVVELLDKFPCVNKALYDDIQNTVLLIGQFDFEFITSMACYHNLVIWHDTSEQIHDYDYEKINEHITYVNDFKELLKMCEKFDLVISNPPYGKSGAKITMNIIQNIKPKQFVNLMPQNDYTRVKGLIQYVDLDTLQRVDNKFEDANVIPWVAKINNVPDVNMTEDDFIIKTCREDLQKFYTNNLHKTHYAIDTIIYGDNPSKGTNYNTDTDFYIPWRTYINGVQNTHRGIDYKWNIEKSVSLSDVHVSGMNQYTCSFVRFNTEIEKVNFAKFWYDSKLMNILIKGMNRDSGLLTFTFPKVDWSRPWTDEEILKEFGYTDEEIIEVLK